MGPGSPLRSVRGSGPYAAAATSAPDDRPLRRFPPGARLPRTAKARKDQDMPDSAPTNRISGRNAFIELLRSEGVTEMFGNPGTTELPVMHALTDYPDMGYTLGLQRSEEHTSELQSLMRISYAVFCLKKQQTQSPINHSKP